MKKTTKESLPDAQNERPQEESDYSEAGVDRTLIRWMLSLTPMERLEAVQEQVNAIQAMREQLESHLLSRHSGPRRGESTSLPAARCSRRGEVTER